jgi:hypothetical protein
MMFAKKISRQKQRKKIAVNDDKTTVKPTVKRPVEDNLIAISVKTTEIQRSYETGTNVRENIHSMQMEEAL